jgi:hypothetical protein
MLLKNSILKHLFILLIISCPFVAHSSEMFINEVMASNASALSDEDGDFEDWIELYNAGSTSINLSGYGLSDDYADPFKWVLPDIVIQSGEFLLVWASGKNRNNPGQALHTNFSIDSGGEEIILTHQDGSLIDELAPAHIPKDISYGRLPDGGSEWKYFTFTTPGEPNQNPGYGMILHPVVFSETGGAFAEEFLLELSHPQQGTEIIYTLDGSVPNESNAAYGASIIIRNRDGDPNDISMIPTNNIPDPGPPYFEGWQPPAGEVFKINVVRARALHPDAPPGPVATHSYLVHPLANSRFGLPWFSLATDPENLFDDEIGIYVHGNHTNYFQDGPDWERPANLTFFENEGIMAFNEDVGIRLHGNTTRSRPRKSMRINTRAEYGNSWLNYQLFPDKAVNKHKRFILRNSGNDWDMSVFRDAFTQNLAKGLRVETQYYRPAIVFVNGEYWGIHNTRDRYNHHYMQSHYGIEEHEMTILEDNSEFKFGNSAGRSHYVGMRSFISNNNLANNEHFETVKTMMDIESFTDFQLIHIFAMNTDWPGNNILYWRFMRNSFMPGAEVRDGRWRWFILDTDFGFGLDFFYVPGVNQGPAHNTLAFATATNGPGWPNPPWSTLILRKLLANQNYKYFFINRFCDLLNTNFREDYVVHVIDSIKNMLEPEMQEHIHRWRRPVNINEWLQEVQSMRSFALQRPAYVRSHIKGQFNLSGTVRVELNVNEPGWGTIVLNTIEPVADQHWEGIYFKDVPINVQARPAPGYKFVEWTGTYTGQKEKVEITPSNDIQLTAHFETSDDFTGDEMNPPAYRLASGPYSFTYWDANATAGSFPPHMVFLQSSKNDPLLNNEMTGLYHIPDEEYHDDDAGNIGFPYRLTRRTRIKGLYDQGVSFINTGRERDLGAALLAIDTRGLEDITVTWTGGTVHANSRVYAIRLQYRLGHESDFIPLTDSLGNLIEYNRNDQDGHSEVFGPFVLPDVLNNQAYLQLRWKYYFTGQQLDPESGQRDELRLDDITVSTTTMSANELAGPDKYKLILEQNYPNPCSQSTSIRYRSEGYGHTYLAVYNSTGNNAAVLVDMPQAGGTHEVLFNTTGLPSGLYYLQLLKNGLMATRKMMIIR